MNLLQRHLLPLLFASCFVANSFVLLADDFHPDQKLLQPAPEGAVVLFDGDQTNHFVSMKGDAASWPVRNGSLVSARGQAVPGKPRSNHLVSTFIFRDADIHVEFRLPKNGPGNSGLYLHGHYELQILNSHQAQTLTQQEMGSLYGFAPPLVNAARPPLEWQVYDIHFQAPRRNQDGRIVEAGRLTAWLNGQRVQHDVQFAEPKSSYHPFRHGRTPFLETVEEKLVSSMSAPLFLQDHDAEVEFRNIWIRPLDENAGFEFASPVDE